MNKQKYNYSGQSLVESVVTLGVVLLLVTGIVVGTTSSLRYAENSKARSTATQYAQEGLELARNERDAGWSAFAHSGTFCTVPLGSPPPCSPMDSRFTRTLIYTYDALKKQVAVQSVVSWIEGGVTKTTTLQTTLTDWK